MIKLTTQQLQLAARLSRDLVRIDDELKDDSAFSHAASAQYELAGQTFYITLEQARMGLVERRGRLLQDLAELGIEWRGNDPASGSTWGLGQRAPAPASC